MKFLLLILTVVAFFSCRISKENENIFFSKSNAFPTKSLHPNAFYSIVNLDSPYYKIEWGHKYLDTLITDTTYSLLGSGAVSYLTSNKHAILLEQECGTSCNYIITLPFNKEMKPKLFYECVAIDTINNLIAYVTENDTSFLALENFLTGKKIKINEDNLCNSPIKFNCVDSCYFDASFFNLKWFGKKYNGSKNPDWQIKKYSVTKIIN